MVNPASGTKLQMSELPPIPHVHKNAPGWTWTLNEVVKKPHVPIFIFKENMDVPVSISRMQQIEGQKWNI